MKVFRKLIRDKIPERFAADGQRAVTRVLHDDAEYIQALENKLLEEVQELRSASKRNSQKVSSPDLVSGREGEEVGRSAHRQAGASPYAEEIADLYEVLEALIEASGYSFESVQGIKQKKFEERGGFGGRLFLESVEDEETA